MTEMILKSSISVLDAFKDVRNNKSLAHDNDILNESESLPSFNHITSAIRFVWTLQQSISKSQERLAPARVTLDPEDIPFGMGHSR